MFIISNTLVAVILYGSWLLLCAVRKHLADLTLACLVKPKIALPSIGVGLNVASPPQGKLGPHCIYVTFGISSSGLAYHVWVKVWDFFQLHVGLRLGPWDLCLGFWVTAIILLWVLDARFGTSFGFGCTGLVRVLLYVRWFWSHMDHGARV